MYTVKEYRKAEVSGKIKAQGFTTLQSRPCIENGCWLNRGWGKVEGKRIRDGGGLKNSGFGQLIHTINPHN